MEDTIRVKENDSLKGKKIGDKIQCSMIVKGIKQEPDYGNTPMSLPTENKKEPKEEIFYTLEYDESKDDGKEYPGWFEDNFPTGQRKDKE